MLPYELATLGRGIVAVLLFVSNVLFWRESGYFAAASELNPLLHTWSMAVEEQNYILFPLVPWACWRFVERPFRRRDSFTRARICDGWGPLWANEGALISHDGWHLTPDGAAYLSKFVFDQGPLAPFANRVTETAQRAEPISVPPAQPLETDVPMNIKETK